MDTEERLKLIKRNTVEIISEEELKKLLSSSKKPVVYWGTTPKNASPNTLGTIIP